MAIVDALQAKGFKVTCSEYEYTRVIALVVVGLYTDRAVSYACDIVRKAGVKVGFAFTSTQHK